MVGKTARVLEEVKVGKDVTVEDKTVSDTVRKTNIDIGRVPGKGADPSKGD